MKRTNRITLAFFILLSSTSLGQELHSDSSLSTVFDKNEIQDLEILLNFFNEQICELQNLDEKHDENCFMDYCKKLKAETSASNTIDLKISFEQQKAIYKNIDASTFHHIWIFNTYQKSNNSDTLKGIELYPHGKYADFLKLLGLEYDKVRLYHENFLAMGDISPSMTAEILMNYKEYNLSDQRIKLLFAIHYLTLNDQLERNKKH